jgi:hypothetical protein
MIKPAALPFEIVSAETILGSGYERLPAMWITRRPPAGPTLTLCAVGDIGLSGRANVTANRRGSEALFLDAAPVLRDADLCFGNLESPLADEIAAGSMFAAPATSAAALRAAGFDVLHLANNHIGEFGQAGVLATLAAMRSVGLTPLGAGVNLAAARQLIRTDVNGIRVGWLGCGRTLLAQPDDGASYWEFDEHELLNGIAKARPTVDVLIVSIHIGLMYMDYPRPQHKVLAEQLMGKGADLVLMHHAHILQGVQVTAAGAVCCYNLGNFLYDWQEGDVQTPIMLREQNEGAIFWFQLDRRGVAGAAVLPTWIDADCQVRWATAGRGRAILQRLARISADLERDFARIFESQRATRNTGMILKVLAFHIKHGNWRRVASSLRRFRLEHLRMVLRWLTAW